jgi:hypothetical protein
MTKNIVHDQIVLGAGPSGISYSLFFEKSPIIIEKNELIPKQKLRKKHLMVLQI